MKAPSASSVPAGYKRTEVGVIPEDWETPTVISVSRQIIDYRGRTPRKLGMNWGGGDIPALSAGNVRMGFIDFSEECYLGSEALYKRWMTTGDVAKDDIAFTTEAPLGNVALIPDDRKYILSQRTVLLKLAPERAVSRFMYQVLLSEQFQKLLVDQSSGTTAKGIQRKKFEQLRFACPPLSEQRAIATTLSDVDALLRALERLITKKADIKQAAMQQLLTGRTRLPGFKEPWQVKKLRDIATCFSGGTPPTEVAAYYNGAIPWITSSDLNKSYVADVGGRISRSGFENSAAKMVEPHTLLIALYGATAGVTAISGIRAAINQAVLAIVPKQDDTVFIFFKLRSLKQWLVSTYTQGGQANLSGEIVKSVELSIPPLPEQVAIAAVLTDMDRELLGLEHRLLKARELKQGIMQELLTGRTRLIAAREAIA